MGHSRPLFFIFVFCRLQQIRSVVWTSLKSSLDSVIRLVVWLEMEATGMTGDKLTAWLLFLFLFVAKNSFSLPLDHEGGSEWSWLALAFAEEQCDQVAELFWAI